MFCIEVAMPRRVIYHCKKYYMTQDTPFLINISHKPHLHPPSTISFQFKKTPQTLNQSASLPFPSTMSPATDLPTLPVPNPTRSFWHTTHPNPLVHHRTTTDLPTRASVIIIGSGITSVFAARELIASGVTEVVVLEARDICSGATGRVSPMTKPINSLFTYSFSFTEICALCNSM
jgi:hypothetical protein